MGDDRLVQTRLPPATKLKLQALADAEGASVAFLMRRLLIRYADDSQLREMLLRNAARYTEGEDRGDPKND